jgi:hypothetical protein
MLELEFFKQISTSVLRISGGNDPVPRYRNCHSYPHRNPQLTTHGFRIRCGTILKPAFAAGRHAQQKKTTEDPKVARWKNNPT